MAYQWHASDTQVTRKQPIVNNQPPWWWPWGEHRGREWLASAGLRGWPPGTRCGGNGHGSHGARVGLWCCKTWFPDMVNIKKCKNSPYIPCHTMSYHVILCYTMLYHVLGAKINGGSEQLGMFFSPSKWLWPPETTWDERNAQKGDTWETWWDRSGHNWWPS